MGRARKFGIAAVTMTAVSAAVLATTAVPASAAHLGAEISICSQNSRSSGSATISGKNQRNEDRTSPPVSYRRGCTKLVNWWWLADGVIIVYERSDGSMGRTRAEISEKAYGKTVEIWING